MNTPEQLRILVVGGTGRIGSATASSAIELGAEVFVSSRSIPVTPAEGSVHISMDASDPGEVERLLDELGELDHIVIAVSANTSAAGINDTTVTEAQAVFTRYWSAWNLIHFGSQYIRPNGSIVLVSGSSGRRPLKGYGTWTALHGAIEALARAAAIDVAPVRINTVSPGGIDLKPDRQLTAHAGKPADVAAMIMALMVNPAVTNTIVDVDGGERLGEWQ